MDQRKHSACDECRVRKLKCSGQPEGCERCHRDGVACHYSVQKPMGRPRKRRRAEDDSEARPEYEPLTQVVLTPPSTFASLDQSNNSPADTFFSGDFSWMNEEIGKGWDVRFLTGPSPPATSPDQGEGDYYTPVDMNTPYGPKILPWDSDKPYNSSHHLLQCLSFYTQPAVTPCNCINRFFSSINDLRTPQPPSDISLTYTLAISRAAIATCKQSLSCKFCLSTFQSGYISNMLLGCLLPLLVVFYQKSLYSIDCTTSPQSITVGENQQVEMEVEPWRMMARSALKKEFSHLMEIVGAMEDRSRLRHPTTQECGNVLVDKKEDVPLCRKIITTIRSIAGTLELN